MHATGILIKVVIMEAFEWEERDDVTPFYIHMIAGSIAGITQHISMIPIDNVKTHCQAGRFLTISQITKKIYQAGGLFNFYSGSSVVVSGCLPAHALYFSIYQKAKIVLNCQPEQDVSKFAFIGALSSMFHDLIMTPAEALKQRLQLARSDNATVKVTAVTKKILATEGLIAFYRSFPINYFMNIPFGSLIVVFNEKLKHLIGAKDGDHGIKYYLCGALAGGIASIPTTPLDVIKTKLNTQFCEASSCDKKVVCNILKDKIQRMGEGSFKQDFKSKRGKMWMQSRERMSTIKHTVKYRTIFETSKTIWREEGVRGFFKGVQMRMMIQSVSSGIGWGTYQLVKEMLSSPTSQE